MSRLIDADALFINLDGMMEVSPTGYIHGDAVADMISDAPTVDAVPVRHGKWIDEYFYVYKCSNCQSKYILPDDEYNFCPNCGSEMREVIEE